MSTYLQYDPVPLLRSQVHGLLGHYFLPLSQWDVVEVTIILLEPKFFAQGFDVLEGVNARGENEEYGSAWSGLLVGLGELDGPQLYILRSLLLFDKIPVI